jgi:hypothetical protein
MDELDISMAPGCYGISLLYKAGSTECRSCPFAAQCGPVAEKQLAVLREECGIKVVSDKPRSTKSTPVNPASVVYNTKLPARIRALLTEIDAKGIKILESLKRRVNPFRKTKFGFLFVATHMLLSRGDAGITRMEMTQAFMQALKVSKGTAEAYALQTVQALHAVGAADEINGQFRMRKL